MIKVENDKVIIQGETSELLAEMLLAAVGIRERLEKEGVPEDEILKTGDNAGTCVKFAFMPPYKQQVIVDTMKELKRPREARKGEEDS